MCSLSLSYVRKRKQIVNIFQMCGFNWIVCRYGNEGIMKSNTKWQRIRHKNHQKKQKYGHTFAFPKNSKIEINFCNHIYTNFCSLNWIYSISITNLSLAIYGNYLLNLHSKIFACYNKSSVYYSINGSIS